MSSKNTWFWFGLAVALFLFILLVERRWGAAPPPVGTPRQLLADFQPDAVTALQVRRGSQIVHLRREGATWRMVRPLDYPAQPVVVGELLKTMARLDRLNPIETTRLADFGLSEPEAIVVAFQGEKREELQIGSLTPTGDQVYVRVVGVEGVYATDASLLTRMIPTSTDAWRSAALLTYSGNGELDRFEIRGGVRATGCTMLYNATNKTWRMTRPLPARVDRTRFGQLLLRCLQERVVGFVTDDPQADPEPYGLLQPEIELVLGTGGQDAVTVQFGGSPSNNPAVVYARRLSHTNIVLVRRDLADLLRQPYTVWRDRHLFSFAPDTVQQIEVAGQAGFVLRRQTNQHWRLVEPEELPADSELVQNFMADLLAWEVSGFEKDVVTDFSSYGLANPWRRLSLKLQSSAGAAEGTNQFASQVDLGTNATGFFARRLDETSVYAVTEGDLLRIPEHGWQLRDRRIWSFSITNVAGVTVRLGPAVNKFIRTGSNDWAFAAEGAGLINESAVEHVVTRLGELSALYWIDRGETARARHGFSAESRRVEIEVRDGERLKNYLLEFGPERGGKASLASTVVDGQPWIFEFPWPLFQMLVKELPLPPPPPVAAP